MFAISMYCVCRYASTHHKRLQLKLLLKRVDSGRKRVTVADESGENSKKIPITKATLEDLEYAARRLAHREGYRKLLEPCVRYLTLT